MINVFFDTNVAYRAIIALPKGANQQKVEQDAQAKQVWKAVEEERISGTISVLSLTTLYSLLEAYYRDNKWRQIYSDRYTVEKRSRSDAYRAITRCAALLKVCDVLASEVKKVNELMSRRVECNDFEDNLQLACAYEEGMDVLITFNVRDFACANEFSIEVLTPRQMLMRLATI